MIPLQEAQRRVVEGVVPLEAQRVELGAALGRRLAAAVAAPHDVPPFPNSAMDGFAVRAADVADPPVTLRVAGEVAAGEAPTAEVEPGTAVRIMTGAPLPAGADTVVRVEDTTGQGDSVVIHAAGPAGTDVRPAGGDVAAATEVAAPGDLLTPPRLGLLATVGAARLHVHRRPRVALLSTGNELRPPETADLPMGAIRDANRTTLAGLCAEAGAEVSDLGIVGDDPDRLQAVLTAAAADSDIVLSSGGVSMGVYDPVKRAYERSGEVEFWQVAMQPGKPFAVGTIGGTRFFGLPGNPVSVMVSFEQFVRPVLLALSGSLHLFRPRLATRAGESLTTNPDKVVFVRAAVTRDDAGSWVARPSGGQGSHVLSALAAADGLIVIPAGVAEVAAGDEVECEMLRWPEQRTMEDAVDG